MISERKYVYPDVLDFSWTMTSVPDIVPEE
jgi:hypothetical protein